MKKNFLTESLKNIKTVGTVTRSSAYLCKEIIKQIDWSRDMTILELGAGDGVITKHILNKMSKKSKLLAFEINENFCEELKSIKDDRLIVLSEDACQVDTIFSKLNILHIDHVISAIPFVILPEDAALKIIRLAHQYLEPDGKFIQVHYSLLAKKLYEKVFGSVAIKFVPFNIPPAFLLTMQKVSAPAVAKLEV